MRIIFSLLLLFSLGACTSTSQKLEVALNEYAAHVSGGANPASLDNNLTGAARRAAEESKILLTELGYLQDGQAKFKVNELISNAQAMVCLDVTDVKLRDQKGEQISGLQGLKRLQLIVDFREIGSTVLISDFRATGSEC